MKGLVFSWLDDGTNHKLFPISEPYPVIKTVVRRSMVAGGAKIPETYSETCVICRDLHGNLFVDVRVEELQIYVPEDRLMVGVSQEDRL